MPLRCSWLQGGSLAGLPVEEHEALLSALETVVEMMGAEDIDAAPMLVPEIDLQRS